MSKYSFPYYISQCFKSFFRNGAMSFASVAVLMSCLTVLGSFGALVYNIEYNLDQVSGLNEIVVFCDTDCTQDEVDEIGRQICLLDNVVEDNPSDIYISKEDAFREEKDKYSEFSGLFDEMEERGDNPYPDCFVVTYTDNSQVSTLQYQLEQIDGVSKIKCRADLAQTIENLKSGIIFVFTAFLAILFVVSLFVIINTIKLAVFARSKEISIMRYVGATKSFIAVPFVLEGVLIGLISSGIAYLIEWYIYSYAARAISENYQLLKVVEFGHFNVILLLGFIAVGVFAGIVGSLISLGKYLKA